MVKTYNYTPEQIEMILSILETIQITGTKSCKGVVKIYSIINNPVEISKGDK